LAGARPLVDRKGWIQNPASTIIGRRIEIGLCAAPCILLTYTLTPAFFKSQARSGRPQNRGMEHNSYRAKRQLLRFISPRRLTKSGQLRIRRMPWAPSAWAEDWSERR